MVDRRHTPMAKTLLVTRRKAHPSPRQVVILRSVTRCQGSPEGRRRSRLALTVWRRSQILSHAGGGIEEGSTSFVRRWSVMARRVIRPVTDLDNRQGNRWTMDRSRWIERTVYRIEYVD